ncbi:hypothetical protein [Ornithinibacillus bavariensis]|uniref:DUF3221 domain-containing protein n=1 Tax=Ornithinibacillus bavariensis TaxID=545502 RepID=A0A920C642_9BACI|nr:hypothetical protein [Ornithinibacillus bavariensis]GIO27521.1 hypothetical protein J43TS3_21320 [Ornithinibacillus bavariensis]
MKRFLVLVVLLASIVLLVQVINNLSAEDDYTIDGYLINKGNSTYLIADENFDLEKAEMLSNKQLIVAYSGTYVIDKSGRTKNGDKVRIWYSPKEIQEMHPARLKVLKLEKIN